MRGGEGVTGDEMVGWYHGLNGPKSEQIPADSEGQGNVKCSHHVKFGADEAQAGIKIARRTQHQI